VCFLGWVGLVVGVVVGGGVGEGVLKNVCVCVEWTNYIIHYIRNTISISGMPDIINQ